MNVTRAPQSRDAIDLRQRVLWEGLRQALLMMVDAIERYLDMERTAELRKKAR